MSKKRKKRQGKGQGAARPPQSDRTELPPEVVEALERQRLAFRSRFGRDPGPNAPAFFDPDTDEPTPMDSEKLERGLIEVMGQAGVDPALMYASNKTGRIVTEMNRHLLSDEDLAEWEDAIDEYYELEGRLGSGGDAPRT